MKGRSGTPGAPLTRAALRAGCCFCAPAVRQIPPHGDRSGIHHGSVDKLTAEIRPHECISARPPCSVIKIEYAHNSHTAFRLTPTRGRVARQYHAPRCFQNFDRTGFLVFNTSSRKLSVVTAFGLPIRSAFPGAYANFFLSFFPLLLPRNIHLALSATMLSPGTARHRTRCRYSRPVSPQPPWNL